MKTQDEKSKVHTETDEETSVAKASALSSKLIYEVIRRDGLEEMNRPPASLWWSAVAAGMLISLSVIAEAIFRVYLPDAVWRHLVESLGYTFGFLVVINGRMQLFTENTITSILPIVGQWSLRNLGRVARLWGVVLGANVLGAFLAAALIVFTPAFEAPVVAAIADLSRHATGHGWYDGFFKALPAGVLVAAIVWMLPTAGSGKIWMIVLFTWLIAAGDFTHVIAGSVEMAYLILTGELGMTKAAFGFFLPVLLGNVTGGTLVFTLTAWGQVRHEVTQDETDDPPA
jgi:formate/nitrite transporter FocA (FNT family)